METKNPLMSGGGPAAAAPAPMYSDGSGPLHVTTLKCDTENIIRDPVSIALGAKLGEGHLPVSLTSTQCREVVSKRPRN